MLALHYSTFVCAHICSVMFCFFIFLFYMFVRCVLIYISLPFYLLVLSLSMSISLSLTVSTGLCPQLHPRLHLILGDPGPHSGDITRHLFPFHPQCDAAPPHVASVRSGGPWPQLGGNFLDGHPGLHMVSTFFSVC